MVKSFEGLIRFPFKAIPGNYQNTILTNRENGQKRAQAQKSVDVLWLPDASESFQVVFKEPVCNKILCEILVFKATTLE